MQYHSNNQFPQLLLNREKLKSIHIQDPSFQNLWTKICKDVY